MLHCRLQKYDQLHTTTSPSRRACTALNPAPTRLKNHHIPRFHLSRPVLPASARGRAPLSIGRGSLGILRDRS